MSKKRKHANNMTGEKGSNVPIWMSDKLKARLDAVKERLGENRSVTVRMALNLGLDVLEQQMSARKKPSEK